MKKTTSSLFAATAALGLIAASVGVAFAAETPTADQPSAPAPSVPAEETPSNPAPEAPAEETPSNPAPQPSTPADDNTGSDDNTGADDNNTGGAAEMPPASNDSSAPAADQGGAGAVSGPVGTTGVTTRGQISTGNGPAPVSARGGIRNTNAPAGAPAASNPTLANTGSVASIAAGAGVIALAGGVTLVVARKRH